MADANPQTAAPTPAPPAAAPAAPAPAAAGAAPAIKPGGSPPFLLIGVIVAALAAGGAAGALFVAPAITSARAGKHAGNQTVDDDGKDGKDGDKADSHTKPAVYKLENLIVNPAGSQGSRFLMTTVAFELPDEKMGTRFQDHEAQVRDLVMSTLERQTLDKLTRPGARDSLKQALVAAVAPVTGGSKRVRVYLPQFVIQ